MFEINFEMILGKEITIYHIISNIFFDEQCTNTKDHAVKIMNMHHDLSHDMKNCDFHFISINLWYLKELQRVMIYHNTVFLL